MDYTEDIAAALEEIEDAGAACTFFLPATKRDSSKPWEDAATTSDPTSKEIQATGFVAFFPAGRIGKEGITRSMFKGNEIPDGFQVGYVPSTPVLNPKWFCRRDLDLKVWAIQSIDPLNVNGQLIYQTVLFQELKA